MHRASSNEETHMFQGLDAQRLVALFLAGLALFNFPLLALWEHDTDVFGLPLFPLALFVIWALLIAGLAWVMERSAWREKWASAAERND
jgi:hypothetical protein